MARPNPVVRSYAEAAVVVAGGSSGIGLASALRFVDAGVRRLALMSRDPGRGERAAALVRARSAGTQVVHIPFDAAVPASVEQGIARAHDHLGAVDVLVSSISAPAYRPELLHLTPIDDLPEMLVAQACPPMLLSRAAVPIMAAQGGGSIVNVASDAAKAPTPGEAVLGAAMAAIVMFTRTLAIEGKRNGIRANVVTPSLVSGTPTTDRVLREGFSKRLFDKAALLADLGVATPEDQAELVVFLGGPAAARLTGQAISVNGGISAL